MYSKFLILAVFFCASVAKNRPIQSMLSNEQSQRIFHCNPSEVPNYETINIKTENKRRTKRDNRPVQFTIDEKKVQLSLNFAEHNVIEDSTPIWTVEYYPERSYHVYTKLNEKQYRIDGRLYQDPQKMATLLAYSKDNLIHYDGVFGERKSQKVVRSLPELEWWTRPDFPSNYHIVYNVTNNNRITEPIRGINLGNSPEAETPLDTLYPKLLVVIEYNYFKKFGENITEVMRYLSIFWNSVNLEYSKISYPRVKIMITGVIIAKDDFALKYIYHSRKAKNPSQYSSNRLIWNATIYFREEFNKYVNFKNYDSTITMVDLDEGKTAGRTYLSGICNDNANAGVIRDNASYDGLSTATHELGHLLSLPHDGTGLAKDCANGPVNTIMATIDEPVDNYIWSECSKTILRNFSRTEAAQCLKNKTRTR